MNSRLVDTMDENKKSIAWTMTADTAMEFFKRCMQTGAKTEKEKVEILIDLAREGQMTNVVVTGKSREDYIKEKAKHFKILRIKKRETD